MEKILKVLTCQRFKYRSYDDPVDPKYVRLAPADYSDGRSKPAGQTRKSAREISNLIFGQTGNIFNKKCITNFFWLWGQFIDHDITLTETVDEPFNIKIPQGDPHFDPNHTGNEIMSLNRSVYDTKTGILGPREQLNGITPYLDASMVYGSSKERNDFLREFCKGKLKTCEGLLPINDGTMSNAGHGFGSCFVAGDIRCNEHLGLASLHTLFVREHNYWAEKICESAKSLCDEEIYQRAKIMVEAEIQAITYNEFLPLLLGHFETYKGYDSKVSPQMSNVFGAAAFRFGHSMVSSELYPDRNLKDSYFASYLICNGESVDGILKSFMKTKSQELDGKFIDDLRNFLFGEPGQGGLDLSALNLQRGRDHGLPDYNTYRKELGLCKDTDLDISGVYDSYDDIDVYVGGLLAKKKCGSLLSELFHKIVEDQFKRIRSSDKFWYQRRLPKELADCVSQTCLSDIIKRNTGLTCVQKNVFKLDKCHDNK